MAYGINPAIKQSQYKAILQYVHEYDLTLTRAATLPGLSGFAFETELTTAYPDIHIDCFENNDNRYFKILSTSIPANINLKWGTIEYNPPQDYKYDLLWLDCCGMCRLKEQDLLKYLNQKSIFAITECKDRRCKDKALVINKQSTLLEHYEYGHMRFRCFKIGPNFFRKHQ